MVAGSMAHVAEEETCGGQPPKSGVLQGGGKPSELVPQRREQPSPRDCPLQGLSSLPTPPACDTHCPLQGSAVFLSEIWEKKPQ